MTQGSIIVQFQTLCPHLTSDQDAEFLKVVDSVSILKNPAARMAAEAENGFNVPEIELIIKASTIDDRRKGACIFCQEYFMDLYLLAVLKTISLKINHC